MVDETKLCDQNNLINLEALVVLCIVEYYYEVELALFVHHCWL